MIVNQSLDLLGALTPSQQALGLSQVKADALSARFDAALLDAAKLLRDNSSGPEGSTPLPKIEAALEAALAELNTRPLDQLQALAGRPQVLKQASDALSQAFGLEPRESALLERALQKGLEGLTAYASKPSAVESLDQTGSNSLKAAEAITAPNDPDQADSSGNLGQTQPYSVAALSQGVLVPVVVSSRTDGGGGPATTNSLSTSSVQAQAAPLTVTVSGNGQAQPNSPASAQAAEAEAGASGTVNAVQGQGTAQAPTGLTAKAPVEGKPASQAPLRSAEGPVTRAAAIEEAEVSAAQRFGTEGKTERLSRPDREAGAPEANSKADKAPAIKTELAFELKNADAPVAIKADSVVTLRADGSWVIPEQTGSTATPVPAQTAAPAAQTAQAQPAVQGQAQAAAVAPVTPDFEASSEGLRETEAQGPVQGRSSVELPKRVLETAVQPAAQALNAESFNGLNSLARNTLRQEALRETVFAQVGEALQNAATQEQGRLVIRLKPAQLGEVIVDLSMVDGKLSARIVANDNDVRDTFVRDLAAFKTSLESSGITVREVSVAVRAQTQQDPGQGRQQSFDWRQSLEELSNNGGNTAPIPAAAPYLGATLGEPLRFSALA